MKPVLRLTFAVLTFAIGTSLSCGPQSSLAQDVPPAPAVSSTGREPVSPKVLEFLKAVTPVDGDDELVQKLKERHNVAVKLLELRVEEYRQAKGDLMKVLDAARLVLDAKLDLANDREAQLAVYLGSLEVARLIEQHFEQLHAAGLGAESDLQRALLARVSVEVQILKLKRQL